MWNAFSSELTAGVDRTYTDWQGTGATAQVFAENELMKFVTSQGETFWYNMSSSLFDMFLNNPDLAQGWAEQYGSGSYATGTDYVPRTGLAFLHEGEQVIPRNYDYPEMKDGDISISFGDIHIDGSEKTWNAFESKVVKSIKSGKIRQAIQSERKGLN